MQIDAEYALLTFCDKNVVVVETKPGIIVEGTMVKKAICMIEEKVDGDFSVVIDRKNDYKLMRFEIYNETNACIRLKGVAIVTHSKASEMLSDLEAPLCRKQFAKFHSVEEAIAWAKSLHEVE